MDLTESMAAPGCVYLRTVAGDQFMVTKAELEQIVQQAFDKFDICPVPWTDAAL